MKNVLGIMGGMGPLATQLFYKMLIEHTVAEKDQDHINVLIIGDASMPDRTEAILSGNTEPVHAQLLQNLETIAAYGAKRRRCRAIHRTIFLRDSKEKFPFLL